MQYMETEIGQMQRNELSINMYSEPGRHAVRRKKIEALKHSSQNVMSKQKRRKSEEMSTDSLER